MPPIRQRRAARARPARGVPLRGVLPAGALLAAVSLLAGGSTSALWADIVEFDGATVTAGNLEVSVGTPAEAVTWQQVTPGGGGASGDLSAPPAFVFRPGDVIVFRVPLTALLQGDNLNGDLTVNWTGPGIGTSFVQMSGTFHIEDASGAQLAPASGDAAPGTALTLPTLVGGNAGATAGYTVVMRVTFIGTYQPDATLAPPQEWDAGRVIAELAQRRGGPGFTDPGQVAGWSTTAEWVSPALSIGVPEPVPEP